MELNNLLVVKRRKQLAEKKGELSISHYRGDLHVHTKDDPDNVCLVGKDRIGSNCGVHRAEELAFFKLMESGNEYLAITNHSRDGSPYNSLAKVADWLEEQMSKKEAKNNAFFIVNYHDERLQKNIAQIDDLSKKYKKKKIINGIETNVIDSGDFDTQMVENNRFELVLASIHPAVFAYEIDFAKYQDLLYMALDHPRTNIMAHIGYGMKESIMDDLDWTLIAEKCIRNKVAIEINLKDWRQRVASSSQSIRKIDKRELPILGSEKIMRQLSRYWSQGLVVAINTDTHFEKLLRSDNGYRYRYWRSGVFLVRTINILLKKHGIRKENIMNCWQYAKLMKYLRKDGR